MTMSSDTTLKALFVLVLSLNVLSWFYVRDARALWANVPPAPGQQAASAFTLGDKQFAYRAIAVMLQNLGDSGGRVAAFDEYNYDELASWFLLADRMDSRSNIVPFMASFYFGAIEDPAKLEPLVTYLREVGTRTQGQKWRWLAHAVYLVRYKMNDPDRALELAYVLAKMAEQNEKMPAWTRQMPAFILNAKGDKEAAYAIMVEILKSSADKLHPNEVNHTRDYICTRILDGEEASGHPLCQDIP